MSKKIIKKVSSKFFEKILSGDKNFEIRLNDFDVKIGDVLILKEINIQGEFTGREVRKKIIDLFKTKNVDWWSEEDIIKKGFVIMGLE